MNPMTNSPKKTTFSLSVSGATYAEASFKLESGDLKDEGRIDSDSVREYEFTGPAELRLSALRLEPRPYDDANRQDRWA